ncbi:MAG: cytochrome C551 [Chloroflexaceae bacterium]|nr:cytochrome C551 [Chloroflexaceae bacterium]
MSFEDRTLICRDCGVEFIFTAGEQEFYAQKGFLNDPVRCPECRKARKQAQPRSSGERGGRGQRSRTGSA